MGIANKALFIGTSGSDDENNNFTDGARNADANDASSTIDVNVTTRSEGLVAEESKGTKSRVYPFVQCTYDILPKRAATEHRAYVIVAAPSDWSTKLEKHKGSYTTLERGGTVLRLNLTESPQLFDVNFPYNLLTNGVFNGQ